MYSPLRASLRSLLSLIVLAGLVLTGTACDTTDPDAPGEQTVVVSGTITNVTGNGVPGASVTFSPEAGSPTTATTDEEGQFSTAVETGSYTVVASGPGYVPDTRTLSISSATTVDAELSGEADVSGQILDSQRGEPIANATVSFVRASASRSARAADPDGDFVPELVITTDSEGRFVLTGGPLGTFHLVIEAEDYLRSVIENVAMEAGQNDVGTVVAAEAPPPGAYRIVLSWGQQPSDLDAHLTGPDGSGGRFHVYFVNRQPVSFADLDRDDVTSYGPETITVTPEVDGTYRYSVHNFSDQTTSGSGGIAGEIDSSVRAFVQVYDEQGLVREYRAPASAPGNTWRVFEMNASGGDVSISDVNTYHTASDWADMGTFRSAGKH